MTGAPIFKTGSRDLSFKSYVTCYDQSTCQIWNFHFHPLRRYERRRKTWTSLQSYIAISPPVPPSGELGET